MHARTAPWNRLLGLYTPIFRRIPMPLKAMLAGLLCGLLIWAVLDPVQSRALESIFTDHLRTQLKEEMVEGRIRFDQNVKRQARAIKLAATNYELVDYVKSREWDMEFRGDIREYQGRPPPWLPPISKWRGLMQPHHVLLLDLGGQVREDYRIGREPLPHALRWVSPLLLRQTQDQVFITELDGRPHILASAEIIGNKSQSLGFLMMAAPLDDTFLLQSQNALPTRGVVYGLLGGDEQQLIASSAPHLLRSGLMLDSIRDNYMVTGQAFFDYGASDLKLQFVTLIAKSQVEAINQRVLSLERRQRAIAAVAFILAFTLIIYFVSARINDIIGRIASFSQRALGVEPSEQRGGDQLALLDERINRLTTEVLKARDSMRRQHESRLRESEAFKGAILEAARDSIITIDEQGCIIEFNPAAEKTLGVSREGILGDEFAGSILEEPFRHEFRKNLSSYLRGGEAEWFSQHVEVVARRADGETFPAELAVSSITASNQAYFTAYLHDITSRKQAETEIRRLATFASENPNPVMRVDAQEVLVYANAASSTLLAHWNWHIGERVPADWRSFIDAAIDTGADQDAEVVAGKRVFSLLISPMAESGHVNLYGRDVTEVRLAEEDSRRHQSELIHVSRLSTMGEMATGIAHELNQPLSAIVNYARGCSRRMQADDFQNSDIQFALEQVTIQAERAGQIIRRMRRMIEKREPVRDVSDINEIVHEALSLSGHQAREATVEILLRLTAVPLHVSVDVVQIEQVILNLIRNALDVLQAVNEGERRITISTSCENHVVEVAVADTGVGIPESEVGEIFHPFHTTKPHGLGMGLPISQTIVDVHGGRLWATGNEDGGATFHFTLPEYEVSS